MISRNYIIVGTLGIFQGYVDSPLWLYNQGTWSNLQINGVKQLSPFITENSNLISLSGMFGDGGQGRLNQTIDLTPYNYVNVNVSKCDGTNTLTIGVSSNTNANLNSYDAMTTGSTGILKLNISSITGEKFIYFQGYINGSSRNYIYLNQIFLSTV